MVQWISGRENSTGPLAVSVVVDHQPSGNFMPGVHLPGKAKGKVSEKEIVKKKRKKERWSFIRGSSHCCCFSPQNNRQGAVSGWRAHESCRWGSMAGTALVGPGRHCCSGSTHDPLSTPLQQEHATKPIMKNRMCMIQWKYHSRE